MGTNKALLRLQAGGPTLIETVVSRVRECSPSSILLVTNTPAEYVWLGLPTAPDEVQGVGPLAGIFSALTHSEEGRVLVVACDMPMLNPSLLKYMLALPPKGDVLIPRWHDREKPRARGDFARYLFQEMHRAYPQEDSRGKVQGRGFAGGCGGAIRA